MKDSGSATVEPASAVVEAVRSGEVAGNGPHAVSAGGVPVVMVRAPSGLRAFQGKCPHQGALLGEGELEGGVRERYAFTMSPEGLRVRLRPREGNTFGMGS